MRYPNHRQSLDAGVLDTLPAFCVYEGKAGDLQHLRGMAIPTGDAERLVYVGERENLWVEDDSGRWRPWMGVAIVEVDPAGNPLAPNYPHEPLPQPVVGGMSRVDLAVYGMTDADLEKQAFELLGERWEAPVSWRASVERRQMFDRIQAAVHG